MGLERVGRLLQWCVFETSSFLLPLNIFRLDFVRVAFSEMDVRLLDTSGCSCIFRDAPVPKLTLIRSHFGSSQFGSRRIVSNAWPEWPTSAPTLSQTSAPTQSLTFGFTVHSQLIALRCAFIEDCCVPSLPWVSQCIRHCQFIKD